MEIFGAGVTQLVHRLRRTWRGERWTQLPVDPAILGENPRWDLLSDQLYWTDISGGTLRSWSPERGEHRTITIADEIGMLAIEPTGTLLLGCGSALWRRSGEDLAPWVELPSMDASRVRTNDAAWASDGSLWLTTKSHDGVAAIGELLRVDGQGGVSVLQSGLIVGNGPTFDREIRCAYMADSPRRIVYRIAESAPEVREPFVTFPEGWGVPDGMAMDALGRVWIAHYGGGAVSVWSRTGVLVRRFETPFPCPTAVAFLPSSAGSAFTVAVTSASYNGTDGGLWRFTVTKAF